jgi:hypothetical protein
MYSDSEISIISIRFEARCARLVPLIFCLLGIVEMSYEKLRTYSLTGHVCITTSTPLIHEIAEANSTFPLLTPKFRVELIVALRTGYLEHYNEWLKRLVPSSRLFFFDVMMDGSQYARSLMFLSPMNRSRGSTNQLP